MGVADAAEAVAEVEAFILAIRAYNNLISTMTNGSSPGLRTKSTNASD